MNYLAAINSVLVRLRERTVESINENEYSSLISTFINDSIQEVEQVMLITRLRIGLMIDPSLQLQPLVLLVTTLSMV